MTPTEPNLRQLARDVLEQQSFDKTGGYAARRSAEALARAVLAQPEPQWQDIATAPKDGTYILACKSGVIVVGLFVDDRFVVSPSRIGWNPSHWLPLPNPPKDVTR